MFDGISPMKLLEPLERKAMYGEEMPKDLTQSEQLYYLSMVKLYGLYRDKVYDREQCKAMKQDIYSTYKNNAFHEHLIQYHADIHNRYSQVMTEAEKHGCPICKKLVRIFDGRER